MDNTGYEDIMGAHVLGQMNENGERFADLCALNQLVIEGSIFPHKRIHKATWISPNHVTENQIDHICISRKFRWSWRDERVIRGADVSSDHHLLITVRLCLKRLTNANSTHKQDQDQHPQTANIYQQMPQEHSQHQMAWSCLKRTTMGQDETNPIETEIRKRKWGWIGHTLRKPASNITRQALDWNPQGKRKVGRPKQTWRRSTDAEIKAAGTTWAELRRTSQNRVRWRGAVAVLCSTWNQEA